MIVIAIAGFASAKVSDSERQILDSVFSPTNRAGNAVRQIHSVLWSNLWSKVDRSDCEHVRELRYLEMTNAFTFFLAKDRQGVRVPAIRMTDITMPIGAYNCQKNDRDYIYYLADFFGNYYRVLTSSTPKEYYANLKENRVRASEKQQLLQDLKRPVLRYESLIPAEEIKDFRREIIKRAQLDENNIKYIWGEEFGANYDELLL